jgi:hypothetical protein
MSYALLDFSDRRAEMHGLRAFKTMQECEIRKSQVYEDARW